MKDEEFIAIKNRVLLAIFVAIVFTIPLFIFMLNKFGNGGSAVINSINKKEEMVIFITSSKCKLCDEVNDYLKDKDVKFTTINIDHDDYYEMVLKKLDLSKENIVVPSLIYVEDGKLYSSMVDINDKEQIDSFIRFNIEKIRDEDRG